jgi:hypothetical protein
MPLIDRQWSYYTGLQGHCSITGKASAFGALVDIVELIHFHYKRPVATTND